MLSGHTFGLLSTIYFVFVSPPRARSIFLHCSFRRCTLFLKILLVSTFEILTRIVKLILWLPLFLFSVALEKSFFFFFCYFINTVKDVFMFIQRFQLCQWESWPGYLVFHGSQNGSPEWILFSVLKYNFYDCKCSKGTS